MREFKFRAWDKQDEKMIQPHDGDFIKWHAMSNWKDCLEVMQYTGLKDKSGKEIYEGDILTFEGDKFIWVVNYDMDCFVASGGEFNQNEELMNFYDWNNEKLDLIVIGNKFEHPRLLEKGANPCS